MRPPKMTRKILASMLRAQKNIFMKELYPDVMEAEEDECEIQQRIYDAVVSTFEICAKIIEGTKAVGPIDTGSESRWVQ